MDSAVNKLVTRLLDADGEDARAFIHAHKKHKVPVYKIEDIGIESCQYFQGRGVANSDWDAVFVGIGDTPHEALDNAFDEAAMDEWDVEGIPNDLPVYPSVCDFCQEQLAGEVRHEFPDMSPEDVAEEAEARLSNGEGNGDLNYYVALYLAKDLPENRVESVQEAFDPIRDFIHYGAKSTRAPSSFPVGAKYRVNAKVDGPWKARKAPARNTKLLQRDRAYVERVRAADSPEYAVRFHSTNVLQWYRDGRCVTSTGGFETKTTFERMNAYLPHGWSIFKNYEYYWWNDNWPQEVKDALWRDIDRRRRGHGKLSPGYFIEYQNYDFIDADGVLRNASGNVLATKQMPRGQRGTLPRGWGGVEGGHEAGAIGEGHYTNTLAWIKTVKAKEAKLKNLTHLQNQVKNINKPDKKKKRLNLH